MERRGIPAAVICTEPFRPTVETVSAVRGMSGYPVAYIQHPVGSLGDDELKERARAIAPKVKCLLIESPGAFEKPPK